MSRRRRGASQSVRKDGPRAPLHPYPYGPSLATFAGRAPLGKLRCCLPRPLRPYLCGLAAPLAPPSVAFCLRRRRLRAVEDRAGAE
eukprot:2674426-Pyramimonas_sp.AAC.1